MYRVVWPDCWSKSNWHHNEAFVRLFVCVCVRFLNRIMCKLFADRVAIECLTCWSRLNVCYTAAHWGVNSRWRLLYSVTNSLSNAILSCNLADARRFYNATWSAQLARVKTFDCDWIFCSLSTPKYLENPLSGIPFPVEQQQSMWNLQTVSWKFHHIPDSITSPPLKPCPR